jgi:hypothetical protein
MRSLHFTAILLAIGLETAPALAQQTSPGSGQDHSAMSGMKGTDKGAGMSGMTMEQQMAHCAEMREQMKRGKPMSAEMQKMMKACDDMDLQMQMPSATKDR